MTEKTINYIKLPDGNTYPIEDANALTKQQITNCVAEIPQRIKLELSNGTVTLKAGSEVIIPNGFEVDGTTPKFDYVTIESDLSISTWGSGITDTCVLGFRKNEQTSNFITLLPNCIFSGSTKPTPNVGNYWLWYDTTNNKIKYTSNNGATWTSEYCAFSLAITQVTNSVFTSINQVFNGMGYIGSTIWVDKGVKGLIPNGRNEDGLFNNIEYTADKIYMRTFADTVNLTQEVFVFTPFNPEFSYFRGAGGFEITQDGFVYVPKRDETLKGFVALSVSSTNGKITIFTPKQPFRAIDYSDKSEVSGWGMPSSKVVTLTAGASGTRYTAPADGWVKCWGYKDTTGDGYVQLYSSGGMSTHGYVPKSWGSGHIFIPVRAGQQFWVEHYNDISDARIEFYYAQGEV